MDDAVQNMVELLNTKKKEWGVKEVVPFRSTFKSRLPCIEINSTDASFEHIESGGGYMCSIFVEVWYWFAQFSEKFAKEELDKKASEIALFIASNQSLNGYAERVYIESLSITALPDQRTGTPIVAAVIRCRIQKEIFLTFH